MMVFCGFGGGESSRYEKGGTGHLTCVADAPDGFHTQILTTTSAAVRSRPAPRHPGAADGPWVLGKFEQRLRPSGVGLR